MTNAFTSEGEMDPFASKPGRRIRWHEGDNFLHEFDDSHLWLHGEKLNLAKLHI